MSKVDAILIRVGVDERPLKGATALGAGFLSLIPLVPYGHQQISPDLGYGLNRTRPGDFRHDVADTVIKDLEAAEVARVVDYEDRTELDDTFSRVYVLELRLREGMLDRYMTFYGLSFPGALLFITGLPAAYGSAQIAIDAELLTTKGASLGSESFTAKVSGVDGLWIGPGIIDKLPDAYEKISPGLRQFVVRTLREDGARG
jgi:hypothetical protein